MKLSATNRQELVSSLEKVAQKYQIKILGFVPKEGHGAGRPLIYYPDDLSAQKELCAKTVGILRDISNLKISFMKHFSEIMFNDMDQILYLQEITDTIHFYCVFEKESIIKKIRQYIFEHKTKLQEIFTST